MSLGDIVGLSILGLSIACIVILDVRRRISYNRYVNRSHKRMLDLLKDINNED